MSGPNSAPKASSWGKGCPSVYKGYLFHILKQCGTLTPPLRPRLDIWSVKFAGLDICGWPNNNHRISSDTILELNGPNSTPKASSWGESCPSVYKGYLWHILKRCGTLPIISKKKKNAWKGRKIIQKTCIYIYNTKFM